MSTSEQPTDPQRGPETVEKDVPDAPPFTGPFFQEIAKRKNNGRDAKILVTADHGQTGVGKTACGVYLAKTLDTSPGGFVAKEKATLDVQQFLENYRKLEPGSASILDEAEQLDARRAMKHENVDASHEWQMRRVNEIFAILILPSPKTIDGRMEMLADYWVNVECRGRAKIYKKKVRRMPPRKVYYETLQTFSWPNMDADRSYQELSRIKDQHLSDDDKEENWVRESEVKDRIEKAIKEEKREYRDQLIKDLYDLDHIRGKDLAPAFDLSASRVRQIAGGE